MKDTIKKKLLIEHLGWIEHKDSKRKTHYYIQEYADYFISICGEVISSYDLIFLDSDYKDKDPVNNLCENCLNKYKRLLNSEQVTTSSKSIIFY